MDSRAFLSKKCLGLKNHMQKCHISKKKNACEGCHIGTVNAPFAHLAFLLMGGA